MTAAIAAKHDLKLWRIDFVGAYLNSLTKEDIYMKQPEGFIEPGYEDYVAKLIHTIYGTIQGGHDWFETLSNTYNDLGYSTSRADPCVRYKKELGNYTITDTYTDDIFGTSNSGEIKSRKDEIGGIWEIKDVGETEYFLGMRVRPRNDSSDSTTVLGTRHKSVQPGSHCAEEYPITRWNHSRQHHVAQN
jgi:hypothetical protein